MATPCPVPECIGTVGRGKLMCLTHWRRVPRNLQDDVWLTWNTYQVDREDDGAWDGYIAAREAAIEAVS